MSPILTADERDLVTKIISENERMAKASEASSGKPGALGRAQHSKPHGCVKASFLIAQDIPADLRAGVFASPAGTSYEALVRFSNSRNQDDNEADAHGMAIKLLDVGHGGRATDQAWQTSQDFILIDDELFVTGELVAYEAINKAIASGTSNPLAHLIPPRLAKLILERSLGPDGHRLVTILADVSGQKPVSPLASHYWSTTPYSLGPKKVKYMAYSSRAHEERKGHVAKDYLTETLKQELKREKASFEFLVHVQGDPLNHPIDKPEVSWSRNGALAFKLATLEIPLQEMDLQSTLADNIVFSPWNCLIAHQPEGKINLVRRDIYAQLAERRHPAPASWQNWSNVPLESRP